MSVCETQNVCTKLGAQTEQMLFELAKKIHRKKYRNLQMCVTFLTNAKLFIDTLLASIGTKTKSSYKEGGSHFPSSFDAQCGKRLNSA